MKYFHTMLVFLKMRYVRNYSYSEVPCPKWFHWNPYGNIQPQRTKMYQKTNEIHLRGLENYFLSSSRLNFWTLRRIFLKLRSVCADNMENFYPSTYRVKQLSWIIHSNKDQLPVNISCSLHVTTSELLKIFDQLVLVII